ncbi:Serine protease, subtilisin family [Daejeonella rubra]|uniref:Serine protease, subtilisin family n=1 Tax=Daejeonella rubra TaxID=990371 RepID=A0A1G9XP95_9SPHI|nr:S8 family peptidase [Daejeonella rubra]SDM98256.1 Serine protease, subtilisin family [Daejeonella rubra]
MADNFNRPHLSIEGFTNSEQYKYPKTVVVTFPVKPRNRAAHGNRILHQLETVRNQFNLEKDVLLPENIIRDDAIYVEISSDWGFELKFDQLNDNSESPKYQILNIRREKHPNEEKFRSTVVLMLTQGGISHFLNKVSIYLNENTKDKKGNLTTTPKANDLIGNIESIKLATLRAFWADYPENDFPLDDQDTWWEVWFRKTTDGQEKVLQNLKTIGVQIGASKLEFAEHTVRLVKGTAAQLAQSLILLDNLAELRKPQEMNDFLTHPDVMSTDKEAWLKDLIERTDVVFNDKSVLICLLDSGVYNKHPLIAPVLPDTHLYTRNPSWGKYGSGGHGTGMAGLALYGDLTDAMAHNHRIKLFHGLESYKIFNPDSPNDPDLYGAITELACSTPIVDRPNHPRVFCLSVTNKHFIFYGRPSSSSASADKISFGNFLYPSQPQLLLVSGGNVNIENSSEYPDKNYYESIHDPGQAYNVITVGSYTRKDKIIGDLKPLASNGAFAPSNSTSATWEPQWPNKPDIVMEGGNIADDCSHADTLRLLTTHSDFRVKIFQTFGDTSAAVALAANMAAQIKLAYPNYWPETVRALMIHSADWTQEMVRSRNLNSQDDRRALLRSVGYGVPVLEKALYSAKNSLTIIAQNTIKPYRKEGSAIRYNEYHFLALPWPSDVLRDEIGDKDVTLKVTLSYYIDPNPGNRQYANSFRYHSHELDFKLIKPLEDIDDFKRRISASAVGSEENTDEKPDLKSEDWTLKERIRSKGSVKKDFITVSGVELARRNLLAIYPKNGWYRTRKNKNMYDSIVRYSLVISIETEVQNIDIYEPVSILIENKISIPQEV